MARHMKLRRTISGLGPSPHCGCSSGLSSCNGPVAVFGRGSLCFFPVSEARAVSYSNTSAQKKKKKKKKKKDKGEKKKIMKNIKKKNE